MNNPTLELSVNSSSTKLSSVPTTNAHYVMPNSFPQWCQNLQAAFFTVSHCLFPSCALSIYPALLLLSGFLLCSLSVNWLLALHLDLWLILFNPVYNKHKWSSQWAILVTCSSTGRLWCSQLFEFPSF